MLMVPEPMLKGDYYASAIHVPRTTQTVRRTVAAQTDQRMKGRGASNGRQHQIDQQSEKAKVTEAFAFLH